MLVPPVRSTVRLTLSPLTSSHSAGMFEMWSHPAVCQYSGDALDVYGNPITLPAETAADSDKIIEFFSRRSETGSGFRWAIVETATERFVGAIGFNNIKPAAELAYHLAPAAWGFGFAREAVGEALRWVAEFGAHEAEAWIEPDNLRSIAVVGNAGFRATGAISQGAHRYARSLI